MKIAKPLQHDAGHTELRIQFLAYCKRGEVVNDVSECDGVS